MTTQSGESDLELSVRVGTRVLKVLIEDKVDAALQPRQAARYAERAYGYLQRRLADDVRTVLVAPQAYVPGGEGTHGFGHLVTLHEVRDWFERRGSTEPRYRCKLALPTNAIDRSRAGWQLKPDSAVTEFWRRYWEVARSTFPEPRMKRPGAKPAASSFIHFYPARLPRRAALIHKVVFGNVDLQFAGQGESFGELEGRFRAHLEPGMSVEPAGKSVVVRIRVPEIDMLAPFEVSAAAVGEGLKAAARLIAWHRASVEGTGSD